MLPETKVCCEIFWPQYRHSQTIVGPDFINIRFYSYAVFVILPLHKRHREAKQVLFNSASL